MRAGGGGWGVLGVGRRRCREEVAGELGEKNTSHSCCPSEKIYTLKDSCTCFLNIFSNMLEDEHISSKITVYVLSFRSSMAAKGNGFLGETPASSLYHLCKATGKRSFTTCCLPSVRCCDAGTVTVPSTLATFLCCPFPPQSANSRLPITSSF